MPPRIFIGLSQGRGGQGWAGAYVNEKSNTPHSSRNSTRRLVNFHSDLFRGCVVVVSFFVVHPWSECMIDLSDGFSDDVQNTWCEDPQNPENNLGDSYRKTPLLTRNPRNIKSPLGHASLDPCPENSFSLPTVLEE